MSKAKVQKHHIIILLCIRLSTELFQQTEYCFLRIPVQERYDVSPVPFYIYTHTLIIYIYIYIYICSNLLLKFDS